MHRSTTWRALKNNLVLRTKLHLNRDDSLDVVSNRKCVIAIWIIGFLQTSFQLSWSAKRCFKSWSQRWITFISKPAHINVLVWQFLVFATRTASLPRLNCDKTMLNFPMYRMFSISSASRRTDIFSQNFSTVKEDFLYRRRPCTVPEVMWDQVAWIYPSDPSL